MILYIIRHPETKHNIQQITQGHKDSPLTNKGKKQAEALGKRLKNKDISKIYSSDLGRCMQTSKIINNSIFALPTHSNEFVFCFKGLNAP